MRNKQVVRSGFTSTRIHNPGTKGFSGLLYRVTVSSLTANEKLFELEHAVCTVCVLERA
jgi:hypothetical protein